MFTPVFKQMRILFFCWNSSQNVYYQHRCNPLLVQTFQLGFNKTEINHHLKRRKRWRGVHRSSGSIVKKLTSFPNCYVPPLKSTWTLVCAPRQRCARSQVQPKPLATGIKIVIRRGSSIDWWRYETGFFFAGKLTGVTEAQHKLN